MKYRKPAQDGYVRLRLPRKGRGEIFSLAEQLLGASRIRVMCEDGKSRLGRIPGKIKKRMWVRVGDVVLIMPWADMTVRKGKDPKAHIIWRYTRTQTNWLQNHRYIKESFLADMQNI